MILEQAQLSQGPFLVIIVEVPYAEVSQTLMVKTLPPSNWWHDPDGMGLNEDFAVNILDMSVKKVLQAGDLLDMGAVDFAGIVDTIKHPDAY